MSQFDYLLDKIKTAEFETVPFKHLEIEDFLSPEHFERVSSSKQVKIDKAPDTKELFGILKNAGYKPIPFPGCVTSEEEYLKWFEGKTQRKWHGATAGFGIVYRLDTLEDPILEELNDFLTSPEMKQVLMDKFELDEKLDIDAGIQKYLHGYEISPHPDIRRKALTWMLNVNPDPAAEEQEYHTYYLKPKDQWSFVCEYWKGNPDFERDWLPWDWCESVKRQRKNNSIVIFAPANDTLHAVKADYDHLGHQRTQFYGNLWRERKKLTKVDFQEFDISRKARREAEQKAKVAALKDSSTVQKLKESTVGNALKAMRSVVKGKPKESIRKVEF